MFFLSDEDNLDEECHEGKDYEQKEDASLVISDMDQDIKIGDSLSENEVDYMGAIKKKDSIHENDRKVIYKESEIEDSERYNYLMVDLN